MVQFFQIDPWLIIIVVIGVIVFLAFTIIYGIRAHRRQVSAGREDLIGRVAEVNTVIDPKGTVFIEGERWVAISDKGRVEPGEEVIITKVEGLKLWVTKKE
ncbi:hypothetical protein ES703_69893 [subsurface metagenome]